MKAEAAVAAILMATILGMGWWAHHQKSIAEDLRGELAQCALRAMNAEAALENAERAAQERAEAAAKAVEAAQKDAQAAQRRADEILKRPAAVPGNDCASAKVRASAWLKSRAGAAK